MANKSFYEEKDVPSFKEEVCNKTCVLKGKCTNHPVYYIQGDFFMKNIKKYKNKIIGLLFIPVLALLSRVI